MEEGTGEANNSKPIAILIRPTNNPSRESISYNLSSIFFRAIFNRHDQSSLAGRERRLCDCTDIFLYHIACDIPFHTPAEPGVVLREDQ
jgi:hypothetical protein